MPFIQAASTSESKITNEKEAERNRRHCRHTGRLVTEQIEMLKVVLHLVSRRKGYFSSIMR
jgi:hypothetical protein